MNIKDIWYNNEKILNNTTKPIVFVVIYLIILFIFGDFINTLNYVTQFIIVGVPISLIIFYYFGKIHDGWMYLLGLFFVAQSWDLILPPFAISPAGQISSSAFMSGTSIDYFLGQSLFNMGITGPVLFFMTYGICFAILYIAGAKLAQMSKGKK